MSEDWNKFMQFNKKLEWPVRICFTIAIFYTFAKMQVCEEHFYPEIPFALTLLALWCYFFKINIAAILLLGLQIIVAYSHGLNNG